MPTCPAIEVDYVLGLGSNLGSRQANIDAGLELVSAIESCRVRARSHVYESAPLGPPQPHYLNAAALITCELPALALLDALQTIEAQLGRKRELRWGPRTLDLDLLWGEAYVHERLVIP